jgi:transcription initiation factor IIF auxiliary subunit
MRILRLIFTCFLSIAILSVGSAAVAMSVNSPCAMQQMQDHQAELMKASMPMMAMDIATQQSIPHMDCMKMQKSHVGNSLHCKSGQDCVMYNVQLANPASNIIVFQPKPQYLNTQHFIAQSTEFVPSPDLFGLWRPPRAL